TVHGSYSINAYSGIMTRGEKIIAVSAFIQDYILNNYPRARPEDICHISGGVSTEEFPFAYQPDATWRENFTRAFPETRQKHLLTLPARITRRKGQIDFLHVLAGMLEKRQDIQGLIVGAPDARREGYARELKQLAHSLGLTKQISFTGHRDDLRNIMAISTLVYSLSRIPEAFGLTALEALSLGKPVIAYDHGGASEVLGTIYPTGLIPPEDRDQTIATSLAMLENPMPVPDTHPFTLEAMQVATIEMYESLFMNVKAG
ncbi:MAG: glycosyltransferase, partial [Gammaproteobacteria bacterium]